MSAMHFHPVAKIRQWARRSHERRELAGLSDLMLHDIGISRADALYLASKPFWKE